MAKVYELASTFVAVGPDLSAESIPVTETLWDDIDSKYGDFAGRLLISSFEFSEPWPTWEMHPSGDEFVCLIEGDADMTLALAEGDETLRLSRRGEFVTVPKGVWHTASPRRTTRMLFVTPGQGTENREQPLRESR